MRNFTRITLALMLLFLASVVTEAKKRFSITSEPSGAQVEMGGQILGKTPIETELDDFWFDGPSEREPRFLSDPVVIKITKDGYAQKTTVIARGPFEWINSDLSARKIYFVIGSSDIKLKLEAVGVTTPVQDSSSQNLSMPGNWYRRAPDDINRKAKDKLERVLSTKSVDVDTDQLFAGGVVCGPSLWEALSQMKLDSAVSMDLVMKLPKVSTRQAKFFKTSSQKRAFWNAIIEKIKGDNSIFVRGATRAEIDYYWATISFNITEPLFIVDIGKSRVLFNFLVKNGEPQIFWMDIIGSL